MDGRLIVCPTPIGNLEDVTLRLLSVLREADTIACEHGNRTRLLLSRYEIKTRTTSYHEFNETARSQELVERMQDGEVIALVSDAGMPVVSDPGFQLIRAALSAGVHVEVLPGPSAVPVALVLSGLPSSTWRFAGFLPRRKRELGEMISSLRETTIAFESPTRLKSSLATIADLDPLRPVVVCRELSKVHEEVVRGPVADVSAEFSSRSAIRGEIVLVIGAAEEAGPDGEAALLALRSLVRAGAKPRSAASVVSDLTGVGANALYEALVGDRPRR
jgi:16S rRNA (cytidine1402-2'-O)-methyltransferase